MKKKLFTLLTLLLCLCSGAWAETVLFSTNFSTADGWDASTNLESGSKSIKGTTISFKNGGTVTATATSGTLNFASSNISKTENVSDLNYYIAIPVSGVVGGTVTVSYTTSSSFKMYYTYSDGSTTSCVERVQASANNTFTITGLTNSNVTIYMGTNGKSMTSLNITTPKLSDLSSSSFYQLYNAAEKTAAQLIELASFPSYLTTNISAISSDNTHSTTVSTVTNPHDFTALGKNTKYYRLKSANTNTIIVEALSHVKSIRLYGNGNGGGRNVSTTVTKISGTGTTMTVPNMSMISAKTQIAEYTTGDLTSLTGYNRDTYYTYTITFPGACDIWGIYVEYAPSATTYAVTYKANGSGESDVEHNVSAVEANMFTWAGHSFTGWNTAADGSGDPYAVGASVTGDLELYAQWEAATYTVTVAKNNNDYGTVTSASVADVAYNTTISATNNVLSVGTTDITATPAAATAEYTYAFNNWTGIPDGGKVTDNVTITANFTRTANNYTLAWNVNGGDDLTGDYTQGSTAFGSTITKPTATREGYVFLGWAESADGAVVNVPSTMPAANKTYYAQWIEGTAATVTYGLTTGTSSTEFKECASVTPTSGDVVASKTINTYGSAGALSSGQSSKTGETQKLSIDASYTAANYYEWTFTENNCTFAPTYVKIKFQSVSDLVQYTIALTDGITTKTTNFVQTTAKGDTLEELDWNITDGTIFAANKTIKLQLWAYKKNSDATAFRLGSPIEIKGAVKALVPVSVGAKGYATYCNSDYALDFTDKSIKAFIAENPNGNEVTFTQVNKIAKGEPVLLYSETNSDSQLIPAIAEGDVTKKTATENYFRKGDGTTAYEWADEDESRIYVLNTTTKSPGFYKANKNKVATTKAYLSMPAGASARFSGLVFDGETTGISNLNVDDNSDADAPIYNLAGQKVTKSYRGVVIQNGKKMLNK